MYDLEFKACTLTRLNWFGKNTCLKVQFDLTKKVNDSARSTLRQKFQGWKTV
uniref:Uncharacterized protein n=1 Tax=Arundo donax TaxID=35708 RepID=A0A0A9C370_ARUDO